jgi:hypothetical protein
MTEIKHSNVVRSCTRLLSGAEGGVKMWWVRISLTATTIRLGASFFWNLR